MGVSYTEGVFRDRNPVKRWLQQQRLHSAIGFAQKAREDVACVLDFGAGSGELCKRLVHAYPNATIICYEPCSDLLEEAKLELKDLPRVEFYAAFEDIPKGRVDVLFCLEVFEHIPLSMRERSLGEVDALLKPDAEVVFGVPVEVGLPALYKGAFRMTRRYGAYDARPKHVLMALCGMPPQDRPVGLLPPDVEVHNEHMGFDHRVFRKALAERFALVKASASPFPLLGTALCPEAYFVVRKR
ncbi:class I SAM-dependent methyltransferase [Massilia yuzhufengensis]|uniref:Methyltransferase domain-containing protein n=1 Tax=Massilia yuzhufengensis TaxID=1164594 RepID=A0A1I1EWR0_9BURK|nr:class I SAM-dependent methyltransferase [Massilia yuzhufengensis]SFB91461.1 Methyltransferase domain-containing protein [Massilia yuzhufengensis]